jgi:hypothetical protein
MLERLGWSLNIPIAVYKVLYRGDTNTLVIGI